MEKILYTKDHCPACVTLKAKLKQDGEKFTEVNIGRDISVADFKAKFPNVRTVPFVDIVEE